MNEPFLIIEDWHTLLIYMILAAILGAAITIFIIDELTSNKKWATKKDLEPETIEFMKHSISCGNILSTYEIVVFDLEVHRLKVNGMFDKLTEMYPFLKGGVE